MRISLFCIFVIILFSAGQSVCYGFEDFDNDGLVDVFVVENRGGVDKLVWYENSGFGREAVEIRSDISNASVSAAGDLDGDAYCDLLVGDSAGGNIRWYEATGSDNQWQLVNSNMAVNGSITDMDLGDLDGDVNGDVIIAKQGGCFWYEFNGSTLTYNTMKKPNYYAAALGDLNNNGVSDVLMAYGDGLILYEATGDNSWAMVPNADWNWGSSTLNIKSLVTGDFDGDGDPNDFVYIYTKSASEPGVLMWREYADDPVNGPTIYWRHTLPSPNDLTVVRMADIDGDSQQDLFCSTEGGEVVIVNYADGRKVNIRPFADFANPVNITNSTAIAGNTELTKPQPSPDDNDLFVLTDYNVLSWIKSTGSDGLLQYQQQVYDEVDSVACGDLDNDSKLDILIGQAGDQGIWLEANGMFDGFSEVLAIGSGTLPNGLAVCDLDGDGKGDMFQCLDWGRVYWRETNGDNSYDTVEYMSVQASCCAGGNLDGDQYGDFLLATTTEVTWYEGTGSDNQKMVRMVLPNSSNVTAMAIGKLDADSYPDLVLVFDSGQMKWLECRGNNTAPVVVNSGFGSNAQTAAIGDVDGDGVGELLAGRDGQTIEWFESNADNSIVTQSGENFGLATVCLAFNDTNLVIPPPCDPMQGDFDNDCYVHISDVGYIADEWLSKGGSMPQDLSGNGKVELNDYALFADRWLLCNNPADLDCILNEHKQYYIHMDYADEVYYRDNLGYTTYRQPEISEFFRRSSNMGVDAVLWRSEGGGRAFYQSSVRTVFPGRENLDPNDPSYELKEILEDMDPLATAAAAAHANDIKIYAWIMFSDEMGVSTDPYTGSEFILNNPEYALLSKTGQPMLGTLCYSEPAVVQYRLNQIQELMSYDIDGVLLCTRTHAFNHNTDSGYDYGYNPPIVTECLNRGVDIMAPGFPNQASSADIETWLDVRAEDIGEFVQQASSIVRAAGKELYFGIKTANNEERGWPYGEAKMPWKSFLTNNWVDAIVAGHYYTPVESLQPQAEEFASVSSTGHELIFLVQLYDFSAQYNTPLEDLERIIQRIAILPDVTGGSFFEALQFEDNMPTYWQPLSDIVQTYWKHQ